MKAKSLVDTANFPTTYRFATHTIFSQLSKEPHKRPFHIVSFSNHVISDGILIWSYANKKGSFYRSVFFLLALFFCFLTCLIFQAKLYIPFSLFSFSSFSLFSFSSLTIKAVLGGICLLFGLWSLWIGLRLDPFKEQLLQMERSAKGRLIKDPEGIELSFQSHFFQTRRHHLYHYAEDGIEKAIREADRGHLRLKDLPFNRRQKFVHRAHLLETLENQLEEIISKFKESLLTLEPIQKL